MKVTSVLSSINRSGGSRVTVEMGNLLLERGIQVRIAYCKDKTRLNDILKKMYLFFQGKDSKHWGHWFKGKLESFTEINALDFDKNEIVIGVGTGAVDFVRKINKPVYKVRYCHGFATDKPDVSKNVWQGKMHTLTVSSTLIPQLKEYNDESLICVVPNGIRTDEYYEMDLHRNGIGMVFGTHPNKNPDNALKLLKTLQKEFPAYPLNIFGESSRPSVLSSKQYTQYPTVKVARELYNRSKVWLVPSIMEGLPGPVLEAMACGCVVITTNNIGSMEVVKDNYNGLVVDMKDLPSMVEKIRMVFSDNELMRKLRQGCVETVKRFSWQNAVDKMVDALTAITNNNLN